MNGIVQQITNALFISAKPDTSEAPTSIVEPFSVKAGLLTGGLLLLWFVIFFAVYTGVFLFIASIAKYIWNSVIPDIFTVAKPIRSVWDMVGLMIITRFLFGK